MGYTYTKKKKTRSEIQMDLGVLFAICIRQPHAGIRMSSEFKTYSLPLQAFHFPLTLPVPHPAWGKDFNFPCQGFSYRPCHAGPRGGWTRSLSPT